jgi:hypothetical protein
VNSFEGKLTIVANALCVDQRADFHHTHATHARVQEQKEKIPTFATLLAVESVGQLFPKHPPRTDLHLLVKLSPGVYGLFNVYTTFTHTLFVPYVAASTASY